MIFEAQDLSAENAVMAAAYIERLIKLTGVTFDATNWRRIVLAALILASKVWEDLAVWNADFLCHFPNLDIDDLNRLEREFLMHLQFTVSLTASVYAKYYFELRALSDITSDNFPLSPLDKSKAQTLEAKSKGLEEKEKVKQETLARASSLRPSRGPTSPSLSLEQLSSSIGGRRKQNN